MADRQVSLEPGEVAGRVIIMPAANLPAALAAGGTPVGAGAGAPSDVEMPHSNQHIAPADSPASTTPDSQHSRRIASSPSARQTASSPSIEPPPT